jgi:hypothetical protein
MSRDMTCGGGEGHGGSVGVWISFAMRISLARLPLSDVLWPLRAPLLPGGLAAGRFGPWSLVWTVDAPSVTASAC